MLSKNKHVLMQEAGAAGAAGGGAAAGAAAGAQAGQQGGQQAGQQAGQQQQQQGAFADAAAARTYLSEYVHEPELLKSVPDEKVVPWATHVKGRVDEHGKQFPADWRKLIAGDNAEHLKTLERFGTPKALYDSYGALRSKLSSGELKPVTAFPDKGTPEEQAAWRSSNGVPEKPEAYDLKLKNKLTDDDNAVIESMRKAAHAKHVPQANVQAFAEWFFAEKDARTQARNERINQVSEANEEELRAEMGADYKPNMNRIKALLDTAPKGLAEMLGHARLQDGTRLGDNPNYVRWFVDLARQVIPAGVVLGGDGGDIGQTIDAELANIKKVMTENRAAYNKDTKMQARYRELLGAQNRMAGKKKAA